MDTINQVASYLKQAEGREHYREIKVTRTRVRDKGERG
jgi:hypothetical protein